MKELFRCANCGAEVWRTPGQIVGRVFCSRACTAAKIRGELSKRRPMAGPDHPRWKGGVRVSHGYRHIWRPDHPNADAEGYVLEHRLVMSERLGRPLRPDEMVHHRNHDGLDNRPENLIVLSASAHSTGHRAEEIRGWARLGGGCADCGTTERPHYARGKCLRCYYRERMRAAREAGYIAPSRRKPPA